MNGIGTGLEAYISISSGQLRKVVKDIPGNAYTLMAEDIDYILQFRSDVGVKLAIPPGLPAQGRYELKQLGLGKIGINDDAGTTIKTAENSAAETLAQYTHLCLDWIEADTYMLYDMEVLSATAARMGIIRLGGDLAGTAANPTVPGKMNKSANVEFEQVSDTSEKYGFSLFTRLGAFYRSQSLMWDEGLKKLTIKGSQAIWEAYSAVTDGNMGIKALSTAKEAFKIFDNVGNFFSVGTDNGKRLTRIFTAMRLMNGASYNETEYKGIICPGVLVTSLKTISIPVDSILTVDVGNISIMGIEDNYVIGRAQFSFQNKAGVITNISRNELRYQQYSSIAGAYVGINDSRIDVSISGDNVSVDFINKAANLVNKLTNVHCEIKYTITLKPEL
jgi:hypothetical protein